MALLEGLWGKNTDKEGMTQEGRQRSGVFIFWKDKAFLFPKIYVVYAYHRNINVDIALGPHEKVCKQTFMVDGIFATINVLEIKHDSGLDKDFLK